MSVSIGGVVGQHAIALGHEQQKQQPQNGRH